MTAKANRKTVANPHDFRSTKAAANPPLHGERTTGYSYSAPLAERDAENPFAATSCRHSQVCCPFRMYSKWSEEPFAFSCRQQSKDELGVADRVLASVHVSPVVFNVSPARATT